jgi:hypothetical protein
VVVVINRTVLAHRVFTGISRHHLACPIDELVAPWQQSGLGGPTQPKSRPSDQKWPESERVDPLYGPTLSCAVSRANASGLYSLFNRLEPRKQGTVALVGGGTESMRAEQPLFHEP